MRSSQPEEWKDVIGFEGLYCVSSFGRVKSLARNVGHYTKRELLLKSDTTVHGYSRVVLCKQKRQRRVTVHRLVAEAFLIYDPAKPIINHKDGVKLNNNAWNLEWSTYKDNACHARQLGLVGEDPKTIPEWVRDKVVAFYVKGSNLRGTVATGEKFGISKSSVSNIIKNHTGERK